MWYSAKQANLYRSGTPAVEVAISLSISRSTVYKLVKEQDNVRLSLTKSKLTFLYIMWTFHISNRTPGGSDFDKYPLFNFNNSITK